MLNVVIYRNSVKYRLSEFKRDRQRLLSIYTQRCSSAAILRYHRCVTNSCLVKDQSSKMSSCIGLCPYYISFKVPWHQYICCYTHLNKVSFIKIETKRVIYEQHLKRQVICLRNYKVDSIQWSLIYKQRIYTRNL